MKNLKRTIVSVTTIATLTLVPVAVHAQDVVTVDDTSSTQSAGVPNTGAAPTNKVAQTTAIFLGGSALGAAAGLGFIAIRKKRFNQ